MYRSARVVLRACVFLACTRVEIVTAHYGALVLNVTEISLGRRGAPGIFFTKVEGANYQDVRISSRSYFVYFEFTTRSNYTFVTSRK